MNILRRLFSPSEAAQSLTVEELGLGRVGNGEEGPPDDQSWSRLLHWTGSDGVSLDSDGIALQQYAASVVGGHILSASQAEYGELHDLYSLEPIDSRILAMMNAVSWFSDRRGDLWQIFNAPIDVGLPKPIIQHKDKSVRKKFQEAYEQLDVHTVLECEWLACEEYGQCYPLILIDKNQRNGPDGGLPIKITLLNPKHIAVGRAIELGTRSLSYLPPAEARQSLLADASKRDNQLFYDSLAPDWNEWTESGGGFRLDPRYATHIHHRKQWHRRYAIPPAARALDDLSTRLVLDEMIRSTIEGVHNQWRVWRVENPMKGEITRLKAALRATRAERTSDLVWKSSLQPPDVISPASIDSLLAPETWARLTLGIYRSMGMFVTVVSGEMPSMGTTSTQGDVEVNVRVFLARLNYQQRRALEWLRKLNQAIATAMGDVDELPVVSFEPLEIEWIAKLRAIIPVLNYGMFSVETFHNWVGLDFDTEIERLKAEKKLREDGVIQPYTGFAQSGPSGTTQHPASPGRPLGPSPQTADKNKDNAEQPRSRAHIMMAAMRASMADYEAETERAYEHLQAMDKDDKERRRAAVLAFILTMQLLRDHRLRAFERGYAEAGGMDDIPRTDPLYIHASRFDDPNLENFQTSLLLTVEAGEDFSGSEKKRAMLYAQMGWRQGFANGMFLAKREQGFTGWKRVLNPSASKVGPCPDCTADSRVVHSIDEPFFDHPNGVCGQQFVSFNMGGGGWSMPYQIPHYGD